MEHYDVAVIGAGPGGYVAAIRAKQLGLTSIVIEKDSVGGVCLNWGCIPSKSLIHYAEMFANIPHLKQLGVAIDEKKLDYSKIHKESRNAATKLTRGVDALLKKNSVQYIKGIAIIRTPKQIEVDGTDGKKTIHAENILIATGSRPKQIPGFEYDEKQILSSTGILKLERLPKDIIILGAGAIGMEFAYVMNSFGVKVTVIEMLQHILPLEDSDIVAVVKKSFEASGITLLSSTKATKLIKKTHEVHLEIEDKQGKKQTLNAEKILVAVGRTPNSENLGLETLGVKTEKGFIVIKDYCQTNVKGIYAIGDVAYGTPLLAHVASKEGEMAVEHIAGKGHQAQIDALSIPSAVYCNPQVGSFGLTEEKAKEKNVPYKKSVFPYIGVGKAVAIGNPNGMVKILVHKDTGEIIGGHAVGHSATEIIHELLISRVGELLISDIANMIHAHPTISESVMESARANEGWAIHI